MKEIRIQLFDHSQGSESLLRTKFVRDKEEAIKWATKLLKYDYPSLHDEFIQLSEGKTLQERMLGLTRIGYLGFKFHTEEI
jgi:hypothetical protein